MFVLHEHATALAHLRRFALVLHKSVDWRTIANLREEVDSVSRFLISIPRCVDVLYRTSLVADQRLGVGKVVLRACGLFLCALEKSESVPIPSTAQVSYLLIFEDRWGLRSDVREV